MDSIHDESTAKMKMYFYNIICVIEAFFIAINVKIQIAFYFADKNSFSV